MKTSGTLTTDPIRCKNSTLISSRTARESDCARRPFMHNFSSCQTCGLCPTRIGAPHRPRQYDTQQGNLPARVFFFNSCKITASQISCVTPAVADSAAVRCTLHEQWAAIQGAFSSFRRFRGLTSGTSQKGSPTRHIPHGEMSPFLVWS